MGHVVHRLIGYDRDTDRVKVQFDIPDQLMPAAKKIANVQADDPEAVWSYALTENKVRRLASLIGVNAKPNDAEFYLEAFAQ